MRAAGRLCAAVFAALAAAGCGDGARDIRELLDEAEAARRPPLPSAAPPPPRQSAAYTASSLRSPFAEPAPRQMVRAGIRAAPPERTRPREPLEAHAIEELRVVGFLGQPAHRSALVRAPGGGVRRVAAGAYLGRDHGRVLGVDDAGVRVLETIPDGGGGWIERRRLLKPAPAR